MTRRSATVQFFNSRTGEGTLLFKDDGTALPFRLGSMRLVGLRAGELVPGKTLVVEIDARGRISVHDADHPPL